MPSSLPGISQISLRTIFALHPLLHSAVVLRTPGWHPIATVLLTSVLRASQRWAETPPLPADHLCGGAACCVLCALYTTVATVLYFYNQALTTSHSNSPLRLPLPTAHSP